MKKLQQNGDRIPHTAAADIAAGDVVIVGVLVGLASVAILTGETGELTVDSKVYRDLPKVAGTAWAKGDRLYYDISAGAFENHSGPVIAAGDIANAAIAWEDALAADTVGVAKINPGGASVT